MSLIADQLGQLKKASAKLLDSNRGVPLGKLHCVPWLAVHSYLFEASPTTMMRKKHGEQVPCSPSYSTLFFPLISQSSSSIGTEEWTGRYMYPNEWSLRSYKRAIVKDGNAETATQQPQSEARGGCYVFLFSFILLSIHLFFYLGLGDGFPLLNA